MPTYVLSDIVQKITVVNLLADIQLSVNSQVFNASEPPDFTLISVDANGDVITVNGFVQASANQNQFSQLLVAQDGSVVINADGNVTTTATDIYSPTIWNAIATIDGEILTMDGEVLWF